MSTERKSCADCIFIVLAILDTSFFLHYNAILLLIQYNCIDISLISMHLSKLVGMESWITIEASTIKIQSAQLFLSVLI